MCVCIKMVTHDLLWEGGKIKVRVSDDGQIPFFVYKTSFMEHAAAVAAALVMTTFFSLTVCSKSLKHECSFPALVPTSPYLPPVATPHMPRPADGVGHL